MQDDSNNLYKTRLTLLALLFIIAGISLEVVARAGRGRGTFSFVPIADIGSSLFTTGVIGVALQYLDARGSEQRASARLRRILAEEAPAIRDAVIDGFAFSPDALTSVSSPEVLERIVRNCLGLQLSDQQMATELHGQLLARALDSPRRLIDSRLSVVVGRAPNTHQNCVAITVHREYRTLLPGGALRFACVGSQDEYDELLRDPEATEVLLLPPTPALSVQDRAAFNVLDVAVDGEPLEVHRLARKERQAFKSYLAGANAATGDLRHVSFTYQVLAPRSRHFVYFDFPFATHGVTADFASDGNAEVVLTRQLDFLGMAANVRRSRRSSDGPHFALSCDDWVLPRAGVIVIWTDKSQSGNCD